LRKEQAEKSIRFSLGKYSTKNEINEVLTMVESLIVNH
jgi:cysteine sulfinate desulfinase/cysteine desulfurase-like protein